MGASVLSTAHVGNMLLLETQQTATRAVISRTIILAWGELVEQVLLSTINIGIQIFHRIKF